MKLITAIINPHKFDEVREALAAIGATGLTATEVKGFGHQKGHTEIYRGSKYTVDFILRVKLELAVVDEMAPKVIAAITTAAKTGTVGDGKIYVMSLEEVIRIRTDEHGETAI